MSMDQKLLDTLLEKSREIMETDKMFHDFAHANNVLKYAKHLVNLLGGNEVVIFTAALFHDIARDVEDHEVKGSELLRQILANIDSFPKDKVEAVCLAVERHENGQITHDEQIVADADKVDAFNELGIGRGFMMLGKRNYTLKKAAENYLELLDKWFVGFHFQESRDYVTADYANSKKFLQKMLSMY